MSQADYLLELFRMNGNRLTLARILENYPLLGSKYTNRISDLRKRGYSITCELHPERPTDNVYTLYEAQEGQFQMFGGEAA